MILNGSYDIGFTLDLALKDLGLALRMGDESGVPLASPARAHERVRRGARALRRHAWSPMVVRLLEDELGVELRAPGFPARLDSARLPDVDPDRLQIRELLERVD